MDTNRYKNDHAWNLGASVFFLFLTALFFVFIRNFGGDYYLYRLGFLDLVIIGMASFRLTRLFTLDKIFSFARAWFFDTNEHGGMVKPGTGIRRIAAELIECPWCTGLWSGLLSITMYLSGPYLRFLVWLLAVAGVGAIFYVLSNMFARIGNSNQ